MAPQRVSSTDATLDAPSSPNGLAVSHQADAACCKVAMCNASSAPHMTKETQSLLRGRLRIAALLLALGFGIFFVRQVITTGAGETFWTAFMFVFHGAVFGLLLTMGVGLCHRHKFEILTLRVAELVIFGLPAVFFVFMQWLELRANEHFVSGVAAPWMLLVLVYSLFIPNTWKRAAVFLSTFAAAPVVIVILARINFENVDRAVSGQNVISLFMTMLLAGIAGAYGVFTINRLRHEAFEAKQLGQYRLKRLLGAGGMGEVHLAEHQLMKRPVAIKLIKPSKAADPQALARFEREVRATAKLTHWNTIEIFDYGHTDDGTFYYVMEYLPGKSLADLVAHHGALAPARVVYLLEQICQALGEAHGLGLIHRDIKPGNIFAAERGGVYDVAKLLDFGLAKPIMSTGDVALTQEGSITGSPLFMAPEQATGDSEPDARSDIYALGAVGYYLLTGHPPFEGDNPVKIMLAHVRQQIIPPSQLESGIPRDIERVVLKCLEKNPADRYASTEELAEALAECELQNRWTRADAAQWWKTNGDTDRTGMAELTNSERAKATTGHASDITHDSASAPTSALVG
jgi:serine/threonine protein kinase